MKPVIKTQWEIVLSVAIKTKSEPPAHHPVQSRFLSKEDAADQHSLRADSYCLAKRGGVARFSLWHHCRLHKAPWLARWSEYWIRYCSSKPGTQQSSGETTSLPSPPPFSLAHKEKGKRRKNDNPLWQWDFQASNAPSYIFREGTLAPLFSVLQLISQMSECARQSLSPRTHTVFNMHAFAPEM